MPRCGRIRAMSMSQSSRRTHVLGAAYLMAQPLLLNILSVPATAYIIRTLGPAAYGQWALGFALVTTASFLTNLGLRTTFVRFVAAHPAMAADKMAQQLGLRLSLCSCSAVGAL